MTEVVSPSPTIILPNTDTLIPTSNDDAIARASAAAKSVLLREQQESGDWCYPLEADCTIPAEYILMMHFMDEIDTSVQAKLANYLRTRQAKHGGWSLYYGGNFDISGSVKVYYALKMAGDSPKSVHMRRARQAILEHGGAARTNVFTRITLAYFGQIPWRGVPFIPVEIMLLPHWFLFHITKVSYWSRTVIVPLLVLCSLKVKAKNPQQIDIRELFTVAPEKERHYFPIRSALNRLFLSFSLLGKVVERFIPRFIRKKAIKNAEQWCIARLNGEHGLGAIFPAMVNAYQALDALGYAPEHLYRQQAKTALEKLLLESNDSAYCQPCVSPVWDTSLACCALLESDDELSRQAIKRGLDWLKPLQLLSQPGGWQYRRPKLAGGGWAFQYRNDYYPDLDDTAVVAFAMLGLESEAYQSSVQRAADWLVGMQSKNGGFASFDADNTHYYLNEIPFADHGALLDPPTSDVTARCVMFLARLKRDEDKQVLLDALAYLYQEQEQDGSWFGRWGTNFIYGTWSVLEALQQLNEPYNNPAIVKAVAWLKSMQHDDGGWGEDNFSYFDNVKVQSTKIESTAFQTAWALLGLMSAGEVNSQAVRRGIQYLVASQEQGTWQEPWFTAPGFPRVFYLKYHGYSHYFPTWALLRYQRLSQ